MMKEYEKLEMSWQCDYQAYRQECALYFSLLSRLSHRYRYCCTFIASTFWSRGKECTGCYFSSMISCPGTALDAGG